MKGRSLIDLGLDFLALLLFVCFVGIVYSVVQFVMNLDHYFRQ